MKTYVILILAIITVSLPLAAQNETDALRFSQNYSGGTARSLGLAGAFGALGGDPSSLYINPAGLGVYRSSEFTFTTGMNYDKVRSNYLNANTEDFKYKLNISNLAYIYTYNTNRNSGWVSASFGVGYNRLADFNRNVTMQGSNAQSSLMDEFVYNSNHKNASTFYEDLAWNTDVLLYDSLTKVYSSDFTNDGYGQFQRKTIETKGGIGEYDFSFGANYSNILYLGATMGVQRLDYEEISSHYEEDVNGTLVYLKSFNFNQHFNAYGTGFNFKFGAILKPINFLRLGLAVHTPTFYKINSEFYTSMDTYFDKGLPLDMHDVSDVANTNYKLNTPFKAIGSIAFIFNKYGLFSFDYEMVDYTKARFRSDVGDYSDINTTVGDIYKRTANIKTGLEGKLGPFAARIGYGYYGNPYTSTELNSNYKYQAYTAGFGFRGKSFFMDLAYVLNKSTEYHRLYSYENTDGLLVSQISKMDIYQTKIMATVGFRF
jgi:hypothetical protein